MVAQKDMSKFKNKVKELVKETKPTFDYAKENAEDKLLQEILTFCETIHTYEVNKELEDKIGFYYYFTDEKTKYLEGLQKAFNLKNNATRLTDISKYLDALTIGESQHTPMNDFSVKISGVLDILYSIKLMLAEFYTTQYKTLPTNS